MKGYVDLDKVDADHFNVVDTAPDATIAQYKQAAGQLHHLIAGVRQSFPSYTGSSTGKEPGSGGSRASRERFVTARSCARRAP